MRNLAFISLLWLFGCQSSAQQPVAPATPHCLSDEIDCLLQWDRYVSTYRQQHSRCLQAHPGAPEQCQQARERLTDAEKAMADATFDGTIK